MSRNILRHFGFVSLLGFSFLVTDISDVDRVLRSSLGRLLVLMHVGGSDRQYAAVVREGQAGDGGGVLVKLAEALLVLAVPYVNQPVRPASGERVEVAVEGYGVHRIYVFDSCGQEGRRAIIHTPLVKSAVCTSNESLTALLIAVAFEGVLLLLHLWTAI